MSTLDVPAAQSIFAMVAAVAAPTAFLTWFIAEQFRKNRQEFYRVMSVHNQEDDDRFSAIQEAQWELREHIARREGSKPPHRKPFPKRRYITDNAGTRTT